MQQAQRHLGIDSLSLDDLAHAGWSSRVICTQFDAGCGAHASLQANERVMAHLDSMVLERADEVARQAGLDGGVAQKLASSSTSDRADAIGAVETVAWWLSYEFDSFEAVYDMAKSSLVENELGVIEAMSVGALERVVNAEGVEPGTATMDPKALAAEVGKGGALYGAYKDLREHMTFVTQRLDALSELVPEAVAPIAASIGRVVGKSPWFVIATWSQEIEAPQRSGSALNM